jgi:sulfonate transport system ATP-binding protein
MASHDGRLSGTTRTATATAERPAPLVSVQHLIRGYGPKGVLNGVDLDIERGEFVALLGPSGCGKSTLLRALAGLDRAVSGSGRIRVPGQVSVVFQDSRLLPWANLLTNVTLGQRKAARVRGSEALAEVGLGGREKDWPHQLSGGEQQRVALARSLVREPELLLADEPFGALDALTRLKMHGLLRELHGAHHPAVLLVTHDVDEAITLADRVVVLSQGRVELERRVDLADDRDPSSTDFGRLRRELLAALGVRRPGAAGGSGTDSPHDPATNPLRGRATA